MSYGDTMIIGLFLSSLIILKQFFIGKAFQQFYEIFNFQVSLYGSSPVLQDWIQMLNKILKQH